MAVYLVAVVVVVRGGGEEEWVYPAGGETLNVYCVVAIKEDI